MPKTDWQIEGSEVRVILEDQGKKIQDPVDELSLMKLHQNCTWCEGKKSNKFRDRYD